jgi:hypothetical protein
MGIVEECAHNSLGTGDVLGGCWRGCIWKQGILDALALSWDGPVVWGILWMIGHGVLIFMKDILDVARHRQVHMFVFIIPF